MTWLTDALLSIGIVAAGAAAGGLVYFVARHTLPRLPRWQAVAKPIFRRCWGGLRLLLPIVGIGVALPYAVGGELLARMQLGVAIALIAIVAYLLIRALYGVEDLVTSRLGIDAPDNLEARKAQTQIRLLRSVLTSFIAFAAVISVLLFVPGFRQVGAGLLASAGIAGIVLGIAAQKALGNLLAGFQIAITQPIRLDDVVVVEGEWGRIEEISLTYVVVCIWDERRLILPISYFLEKPFTNWTRRSSEILGTVFLHMDYRVPIEALRSELDRVLGETDLWDGRVKGIVVTDSKDETLQLRALVSAADAGRAWDLRCHVREKLVTFLQQNYPDSLPRIRAEIVDREEVDREQAAGH